MAIVVVTYTRDSRQYCRDRRLHLLVFSQSVSVVSKETRVNHPSVDSARDGERRNPSVSFKSDPCAIWVFFILYGCSVLGAALSNGRAAVELDPIILCHAFETNQIATLLHRGTISKTPSAPWRVVDRLTGSNRGSACKVLPVSCPGLPGRAELKLPKTPFQRGREGTCPDSRLPCKSLSSGKRGFPRRAQESAQTV
jgi:hypothetical protein